MNPHHKAWLEAHPDRDQDWLEKACREGFDVHHIDGDRDNHAPDNLVLIERLDHFRLHNGSGLKRLVRTGSGWGEALPTKSRLTIGESAYRMRQSGMKWADIGKEHDYLNYGSVILASKSYAKYHKFEWPVKRLPGAKNTEGKF